ncbi:hypothetical protein T07_9153 [Trichinella nelsoni]|uniref:Uncharacterized protein n=3 Tax=Trichinella TaxID=6333 RepID=A0A0V1DAQ4_TRIBR|nr:hypothetical protein T07_9153 [Trichinella nelsoni]KRX50229.1 hypothetical protein T05_3870 [Trichinella murrelli]KRX62499.1 hypothetical protein T09_13529 [Trichinella sp. T9]KRY58729.1 hypothetical protein T03_16128 [Trichinella britovi]KRZ96344.1 hypothetical protein T08_7954 [Trichinella sp. T8]
MSDQSGWTIQLADTSLDQLDRSRSDIESFGRVGFKARLHLADVETNIFWLVNFKSSVRNCGFQFISCEDDHSGRSISSRCLY